MENRKGWFHCSGKKKQCISEQGRGNRDVLLISMYFSLQMMLLKVQKKYSALQAECETPGLEQIYGRRVGCPVLRSGHVWSSNNRWWCGHCRVISDILVDLRANHLCCTAFQSHNDRDFRLRRRGDMSFFVVAQICHPWRIQLYTARVRDSWKRALTKETMSWKRQINMDLLNSCHMLQQKKV